jgi:hypothetical protein
VASLLFWGAEQLYFVMTFSIEVNGINTIYSILNPDKLINIHRQSP